jgi:hypothetical protein
MKILKARKGKEQETSKEKILEINDTERGRGKDGTAKCMDR